MTPGRCPPRAPAAWGRLGVTWSQRAAWGLSWTPTLWEIGDWRPFSPTFGVSQGGGVEVRRTQETKRLVKSYTCSFNLEIAMWFLKQASRYLNHSLPT